MNILLISYFYGEEASGIISERIACELAAQGQSVIVVTSSNYSKKHDVVKVIRVSPVIKESLFVYRVVRKFFYILGCGRYIWHKGWQYQSRKEVRRLIKKQHFDWIYCRSTPFDANMVMVGVDTVIPVLQHFTDPLPPEGAYLPKGASAKWLLRKAEKIVNKASLLSFGNEFMYSYQVSLLNKPIKNFFISYDASSSSELHFLPKPSNEVYTIVYLGNIYGARNPRPLIEAMEYLGGDHLKLVIYSKRPRTGYIQETFVEYKGVEKDVFSVMEKADLLLDLDGDSLNQVYISSKLKDYLLVNRPILSITPQGSPSSMLLSGLKTARVVNNDFKSISAALNAMRNIDYQDVDYYERKKIINMFSPSEVVKEIIKHMTVER